jgi:hypothetical protein
MDRLTARVGADSDGEAQGGTPSCEVLERRPKLQPFIPPDERRGEPRSRGDHGLRQAKLDPAAPELPHQRVQAARASMRARWSEDSRADMAGACPRTLIGALSTRQGELATVRCPSLASVITYESRSRIGRGTRQVVVLTPPIGRPHHGPDPGVLAAWEPLHRSPRGNPATVARCSQEERPPPRARR